MDVLAAAISDAPTIPLSKLARSTYPFGILPFGEMGTFVPADLIREVADALSASVITRFPAAEDIVSPEPAGHTWGMLAAFLLACSCAFRSSATDGAAVVSKVNGRVLFRLTLFGRADHAATTPPGRRRDALAGAAEITSWVETSSASGNLPRATVGWLELWPACVNVIPCRVEMTIDLRSASAAGLCEGRARTVSQIRSIAHRRGLELDTAITETSPAVAHRQITSTIGTAAAEVGAGHIDLVSQAGHDAHNISRLVPMGPLFVPSTAGISHAPDKDTSEEDLVTGANVLLHTLVGLDQRWT